MGAVLSAALRDRLRRILKPRRLLVAGLIVAVILGAQYWQTRDLPQGMAPPLAGVLIDGTQVKIPGGDPEAGRSRESDGAGGPASGATLVAFWATWCPVCSAEEDNIVVVAKAHRVVSVAMQSGDAATVMKHLKERGIVLPVLVDADGRHAMNWRVRGVPTHFVVDGTGTIRFRVVGYATTWGLKARLWWAETFAA